MSSGKLTILITGGCGYIGSRCAFVLQKKGYKVIIVDKATPEERGVTFPGDIEVRQFDLRNPDTIKEALQRSENILHLAANIGSMDYMHKYQADIIQENSAIDAQVYPAAVKNGVKTLIYSSTSMAFQNSPVFPYTEDDLKKVNLPTNVYGMSKLIGEYFCRSYHEQYGLNTTIVRYHNIYGPGEDSKGEEPGFIHVIPALLEKIHQGQYPLEILGDPASTRPFTYVDDAVKATVMVTEQAIQGKKDVVNNDFNIGTRKAWNILDLAKKLWEIFGDGRPFQYTTIPTTSITARRREMNPDKIEKIVGWNPKMQFEEGLQKTWEWITTRKNRPFSIL